MTDQLRGMDIAEREITCSKVMQGHEVGVYGALLLRDGRLLSYSPDERLKLWDPYSGELLGSIPASEDSIGGAFQIDDDHVITWPEPRDEAELGAGPERDGFLPEMPRSRYPSPFEPSEIVVWNVKTHARNALKCECISPVAGMFQFKNSRIYAWSLDGSFSSWYAEKPDTVYRCNPLVKQMWDVILLSDERQLLRSNEHELRILGTGDGFDLVLRGHQDSIRYACELKDKRILSCSDDRTLRIWNSEKGVCERVLRGHTDAVIAACELPDTKILSWSFDDTFRIWDSKTGKCLNIIHDKRASKTWRAIQLTGWKIVLWSLMTESWLFNPAEQAIEAVLSGHTGTIRGFVPLPNGNVISYSDDRTLRIWETGARERATIADTPTDQHLQMMLDELGRGDESETGTREEGEVNMGTLLSYEQRCKSFSRPRRTSGHDRQQQHERSTVMSEKKSDAEAVQAAQKCFMDYLVEEGFRPEIDKDRDIHFKAEGRNYYIVQREKDPQFVQLLHPYFWSIENEEERQKVLVAADFTTARCKCCKVFIVEDNTSAAIELFVAEPSHAVAVLQRALSSLQNGVKKFIEEMQKETP